MNDYPLTLFSTGGCSICRFDIANLSAAQLRKACCDSLILPEPDSTPPSTVGRWRISTPACMPQKANGDFVTGLEVFRLATAPWA